LATLRAQDHRSLETSPMSFSIVRPIALSLGVEFKLTQIDFHFLRFRIGKDPPVFQSLSTAFEHSATVGVPSRNSDRPTVQPKTASLCTVGAAETCGLRFDAASSGCQQMA